jgi:lipid-A-disaccharide synthase
MLKFVVAVPEPLYEMTRACFPAEFPVIVDRASDALCACDAAVVKMGSATLEAAVMGAPQVAVYDLGAAARLEWVLLWMWKRIPFIAMPNIILQRLCIPELLGLNCRPELIADGIQRLLNDAAAREQMLAGYAEIRDHLGAQSRLSATEKTVKILEDMLGVSSDPHPTSP